jgi:hypothetical protein
MDKGVIVREWIDYATKDINSAKYLLGMRPIPLEIICYHCEQAAEKILKCFLIHQDEEPPRTHDLKLSPHFPFSHRKQSPRLSPHSAPIPGRASKT